ncbi:peptidoglycan-binding protein [Paracoccus sp. PS-1]|uniref:peptidoglycan-binding protein n=1 Tax=Paracoccus sp. PS1 TaxID=2963938 RepID=UPI0027E4CB5C|nr:peptidoglycan-binding protein [Paracoccus sp. PS1]MDQ7262288.1 peptidoglycan-binding protein [Paracoccus sp. PS1]
MLVTAHTLAAIAGAPVNDNMVSTAIGLQMAGVGAGLERPHRLAMYLGQLSHESMGWRYDREIWGPTAAQKRYEGRADLGNTQPGDGSRFRGRGPIQITGRANYASFTAWARKLDRDAPDFVAIPDAVNSNPWEGLGPIWYWSVGNPDRASLNRYADAGNYEMLTRRINGGLNGYADRQARYARAALVLMGRNPADVKGFQKAVGIAADGVVGAKTVAALHGALASMPPIRFTDAPKPAAAEPSGFIAALLALLKSMFGGSK